MMTKSLFRNAIVVFVILVTVRAATAQKARWVETHSWSGLGTKQTEVFWVNGDKWRIRYSPHGTGIFQIGVYDKTGQLLDMAADQDAPLKGTAVLTERGSRYLTITGIGTKWDVRVEQFLSVIEEWQLTQLMRQPSTPLVKLGTWTGETIDAEYEFTVPAGRWKVVHSNSGGGFLQIIIEDQNNFVALAANTSDASEDFSWVHRPGKFVMKIIAANTSWKVDVFCEQADHEQQQP